MSDRQDHQRAGASGGLLAFGGIWSGQVAGAVSVGLQSSISSLDLTWLRLVWASLIFILLARPWRQPLNRRSALYCVCLGATSGGMSLLAMASFTMLPLGTSMALQFIGPMGIAVCRVRGRGKLWCLPALVGVLVLTEPWKEAANVHGVFLALGAGLLWAAYILLTQRVGATVVGLNGLAYSVPVAAFVATCVTGVSVVERISPSLIWTGLGVALLLPVVPYVLELLSLRRVTAGVFGILMSIQPAVAVVVGFIFLAQLPQLSAVLGILLVVVGGVGATLFVERSPRNARVQETAVSAARTHR